MEGKYNYHDVTVYIDGVPYKPSGNYALQLICTKAGGWNLWKIWDGKEELIGGEYESQDFCITVGDVVICGTMPSEIKPPEPIGGWNGLVINHARA